MKFNTELLQKTLPEWRLYFLHYAVLKRLIQHILASERATLTGVPQELNWSSSDDELIKRKGKQVLPNSVPRQQFWTTLDKELEKIKRFYALKITWAEEQLLYLDQAVLTLEESCRKETKENNKDNHNYTGSPRVYVAKDTIPLSPVIVSSIVTSNTESSTVPPLPTSSPISTAVPAESGPFSSSSLPLSSPSQPYATRGLTLNDITTTAVPTLSPLPHSTVPLCSSSPPSSSHRPPLPPLPPSSSSPSSVPLYRQRDASASGTDSLIDSIRNSPNPGVSSHPLPVLLSSVSHPCHPSRVASGSGPSTTAYNPTSSATTAVDPYPSPAMDEHIDREFSPTHLRDTDDILHLDDNESILSCSASRLASPSLIASPGRASLGHLLDNDTLSLDQGPPSRTHDQHSQPLLSASSSFTNLLESTKDEPPVLQRHHHHHRSRGQPLHRSHSSREEFGGSDTPGLYGDDEGSLVYTDTENDSELYPSSSRYHRRPSSLLQRVSLSSSIINSSRTHVPSSVNMTSPADDDHLSTVTGITSLLNSSQPFRTSSGNYSLSKRYSLTNEDRTSSPLDHTTTITSTSTTPQEVLQSRYRAFFTEHGTTAVETRTAEYTGTISNSFSTSSVNPPESASHSSSISSLLPLPPSTVPLMLPFSASSLSPPTSPLNRSVSLSTVTSPVHGSTVASTNTVNLGDYVRLRKQSSDLVTELTLLAEYLRLNDTAVYKIVKKFDKNFNEKNSASFLESLHAPESTYVFLLGQPVAILRRQANTIIERLRRLQPEAKTWSKINVYTIGTFDLMHHGHVNLLQSMRIFGATVIAGIHDDVSYQQLKGQPPVDTLAVRMNNIRPYCDTIFVIPSTDPTPYIQGAIRPSDLEQKRCVYVRGDDMPNFPGRTWIEQQNIPIYLLPRTEGVSSSFVRAVYHNPKLNESITSPSHVKEQPPLTPNGSSNSNTTNLTRSTSDIPAWEDTSMRKALILAFSKLDEVGKPIIERK